MYCFCYVPVLHVFNPDARSHHCRPTLATASTAVSSFPLLLVQRLTAEIEVYEYSSTYAKEGGGKKGSRPLRDLTPSLFEL